MLQAMSTSTTSLVSAEVIAQGITKQVERFADLNTSQPGNQPGWELLIDGVHPLDPGANSNCCDASVRIRLAESSTWPVNPTNLDWPIEPGESVEFRGPCYADGSCTVTGQDRFYLKSTSG